MGYYASFCGEFVLKPESEIDADVACKAVAEYNEHFMPEYYQYGSFTIPRPDCCEGMEVCGKNGMQVLSIDGYDKYHEDDWQEWLYMIMPFITSGSVSFTGEDGYLWKLVVVNGSVTEYGGVVSYPGCPPDETELEQLHIRNTSADICDLFEELLKKYDIMLPDPNRTGDETEACIFGDTYSELEDSVTGILAEVIKQVRLHPDLSINTEEY